MNQPYKVSGVIITYNEAKNIERCIRSILPVVDEVLVVDSYSTDETVLLAEKLGAKVIQQEFLGHIEQKNFAKNQAKHPWILSLDADEEVSIELVQSIQNVFQSDTHYDGYSFNRLTNFCGKWVKYCGWYPDKKLRFFPKETGNWGGMNPHDKLILPKKSKIKHLEGDLLHYSFSSVEEHLNQIEKFSSIGAKSYHEKGKKAHWYNLVLNPLIKWVKKYIFQLGFLDGKYGWIICKNTAYATYLKYKKLKKLSVDTK